jgi:hypothetical protein
MSRELDHTLMPGSILVLSWGEYEDQITESPVRVIKPLHLAAVAGQYISEYIPTDAYYIKGPDCYSFGPWLVANGYVEAMDDVYEWHVGYNRFGDY